MKKKMNLSEFDEDGYVSIWLGKNNINNIQKYMEINHDTVVVNEATFEMGKDFGIWYHEEDYDFYGCNLKKYSNRLEDILGGFYEEIEEYETDYWKKDLKEQYNCFIILFDVHYDGHIMKVKNDIYGEFEFFGSFYNGTGEPATHC